ncbi:MAG: redoxin family protein [Clostridium sp.]|nr:redoxin family protein [Clostridium sp.]
MFFSAIAAKAEGDSAERVTISGRIANMTEESAKAITAINCNPWPYKISRHAAEVDSSGHFNTYIEIPYGHNFTIYYDRNFFCQYAEPGDSLFLEIDAANLKSGARYSGSRERLNNEYGRAYADLFSKSFVELPAEEMPKEEYLENFKKIYSGLEGLLDEYADSVGMGEDSKDLMRRSLLFSVANNALDHKDKTPERVLEFFEDPIFGLDDEDNLREMMFPYHMKAYLSKLERALRSDSISQMVDAVLERHPKSLNRDVMLAILLTRSDEGDDYPKISRDTFVHSGIYSMLYGQETGAEPLPKDRLLDGKILELKDGEAIDCGYSSLSELIKKEFNGKLVYLDLWATWCGPCLESNKSLPEVAGYFKEKDIAFVSVAMRSDFDKWKKLVDGHPENCRNFFIADEADAELIMSAFGMNGFPAYRIISNDSEIISSDPPRPNNPAIYDRLLNLL